MKIEKLIVVAGGGIYPRLLIEGAKKAGVKRVDVLAIKGSTLRATRKAADNVHAVSLGEIASAIRWCGEQKYDGAILAGQVNPLSLFRGRFDDEVRAWLAELEVKNAHTIFGKLAEKFDAVKVPLLPANYFMDDYLPGEGLLTNRELTEKEKLDIDHAIEVARDVGHHDVGQTVMVKSGMVLAVEAFEGTNAAIRRGGKLGGKGSIIFKAARDGHDMRFDIPVVGLKTLKVAKRAGASVIAFQAGRLVLLEKEKVLAFANKYGIAMIGIESGLPKAPIRP